MEQSLRKRIAKKGWVTRELNRVDDICDRDIEMVSKPELEESLEQLKIRIGQLELAQAEVEESIDPNLLESDIEEAYQFSAIYRKTVLKAGDIIERLSSKSEQLDSLEDSRSVSRSTSNARLPQLEIPSFSGDAIQWFSFIDQFRAVVDSQNIPAVTKFSYLKSCLRGDALSCISGLALTDRNYASALEILTSRFGRREKIIFSHIQGLLNLKVDDNLWTLYDNLQTHVRQLADLNVDGESYGVILTPMILSKIPSSLRMEWARVGEGRESDLNFLLEFLNCEINRRERADLFKPERHEIKKSNFVRHKMTPTASALQINTSYNDNNPDNNAQYCRLCKNNSHTFENCRKIQTASLEERKSLFSKTGLCFKCSHTGHRVKECRQRKKCKICQGEHHFLLCFKAGKTTDACQDKRDLNPDSNRINKRSENEGWVEHKHTGTQAVLINNTVRQKSMSYLQMAGIRTFGAANGACIKANVIFDTGSDKSYISSSFAKKIKPTFVGTEDISFLSFGSRTPSKPECKNVYKVNLMTNNSDIECIDVVETHLITSVVARPDLPGEIYNLVCDLDLVDECNVDKDANVIIDILIGVDNLWRFMKNDIIRLTPTLIAQNTLFGWIISGSTHCQNERFGSRISNQMLCLSCNDDCITKLWDLDSIGIKGIDDNVKASDSDTLTEFNNNVTFDLEEGKYTVALPWKEGMKERLTDNKRNALFRLKSLTKKLDKDLVLKDSYNKALEEMEATGVIKEIPADHPVNSTVFYLPHRPVIRPESLTTKIRPVFDASAKDVNGISLNDCLEKGPNLYPNLVEVILRFRRWKYALSADISKAFLQMKLNDCDKDVHRFIWDVNGRLREMRFERVTFGIVSSPFLLNATIQYHLSKYEESRLICELKENLYVDDFLSGTDNEFEVLDMIDDSSQIMNNAGFTLTKWGSNSTLLSSSPSTKDIVCQDDSSGDVKVLGMKWSSSIDYFSFGSFSFPEGSILTKRILLSLIARIFDPMGYLSPFLMFAKIHFQQLWLQGVGWDEVLGDVFQKTLSKWIAGLQILQQWKLPRCFLVNSSLLWTDLKSLHFHCFSDASQKGYGCVIYLVASGGESTTTSFVISKARVAPVKKITLARLELLGCLLAARLLTFVVNSLKLNIPHHYTLWTDSKIALAWIKGDPCRWKQFVLNRVQEIHSKTSPANWRFCPGLSNPADFLTRGKLAEDLIKSTIWINGPKWLGDESFIHDKKEDEMYDEENVVDDVKREEKKMTMPVPVTLTTNSETTPGIDFSRYSDFTKICNIVAWMLRFIKNTQRSKDTIKNNVLSPTEKDKAKLLALTLIQKKHFAREIQALMANKEIKSGSPLYRLNPFIDDDGLLKAQGRLEFAKLSYDERHPIILPKCHETYLLVRFQHLLMKHSGVETLVTTMRNSYWIVGLRVIAKQVCRTCFSCRKFDSRHCTQPLCPLPKDRVNRAQPFAVTGMDYCGPIFCADTADKKLYILLSTCAVLRCIDLQIVESLSFTDFMFAFRKFCARRGLPSVVYSDNFSTFKHASKYIEINYKHLSPTWKFNVPLAPWYGGWFERLVRSVKSAIKKSIGSKTLTRTEMDTALVEIEACINSRPLTYSGNELEATPITPARFLIGRASFYEAPLKFGEKCLDKQEVISRNILQDTIVEYFWSIWSNDYIRGLPNPKSAKSRCDLTVGSLVLVRDDKIPRLQWPVAVVTELRTSKDGLVRSVVVRTNKRTFVRAIQSLHNLEICDSDSDNGEDRDSHCSTSGEVALQDKSTETESSESEGLKTRTTRHGRIVKKPDVLSL